MKQKICLLSLFYFVLFFFIKGERGECLSTKAFRSAPGGSGAGGSVVIITKTLLGNPNGKILVQGGTPVKCAHGTGGGKLSACAEVVEALSLSVNYYKNERFKV